MYIGKTIFLTKINNQDFLFNFEEEIIFILVLVGVFMVWGLTRYLILQNLKAKANDSTHLNFLTLIRAVIQTTIFLSVSICPTTLLDSTDDTRLNTLYSFSVERHPYFWSYGFGESTYVMLEDESLNLKSYTMAENDMTHAYCKVPKLNNDIVLRKDNLTSKNKIRIPNYGHLPQNLVYKNQTGVDHYPAGNKINGVNDHSIFVPVEKVATQPNRGNESELERWLVACESHLEKKRINKQKELELHEETIAIKTFLTAFYVVTGIRRLTYVISLIIKAINEG